jgi:hypothetical protein
MIDEKPLPVELRLQAEANAILQPQSAETAARLWAAYRRRQAAPVRALALFVGVSVTAAAAVASWHHFVAVPEQVPAVKRDIAKLEAAASGARQALSTATEDRMLSTLSGDEAGESSAIVVPFVIEDPASPGGLISGVYVPEQVEPIDVNRLPPAEREAVGSLLGIDANGIEQPTI